MHRISAEEVHATYSHSDPLISTELFFYWFFRYGTYLNEVLKLLLKFLDIVVAHDDVQAMPQTILGAMILVSYVLSLQNIILYEKTQLKLYANIVFANGYQI